jgi:hypothetical protein
MIKLILLLILIAIPTSHSGTIDLQHFDLDSKPIDLLWCGASRDTVLVITELNSLYRSDDKGFSWKKLNDVMTKTGTAELDQNDNEVLTY